MAVNKIGNGAFREAGKNPENALQARSVGNIIRVWHPRSRYVFVLLGNGSTAEVERAELRYRPRTAWSSRNQRPERPLSRFYKKTLSRIRHFGNEVWEEIKNT